MKSCLLILAFLLTAVGSAAADDAHLRVGVILPLSGPFAEFGGAVRNGIELARHDHSDKFSRIDFLFEDDHYDPKSALSAAQKLRSVDHVDLIFVWGNEPALALAPVAERQKFPLIAIAQHPKVGIGYRFVIRFINPIEDYSKKIAEYLTAKGTKKVEVLQSEISFFDALIDSLREQTAGNVEIEQLDKVNVTDYDFNLAIAKLKSRTFDALGLYLTAPQLVQFYKQAGQQGLKFDAFGTTTFESKSVLQNSLASMEGAVYSQIGAQPEFTASYRTAYGIDAQLSYAANSYDFANALASFAPQLGAAPQADSVLGFFRRMPPTEGAAGHFEFKESPASGQYFQFEVVLKQIRGGEMVQFKPSSNSSAAPLRVTP